MRITPLALLLLAGCITTPTELREGKPVNAIWKSAKPPAEIATCLAERLSKMGAPSIYPSPKGVTTVTFFQGPVAAAVIDIESDGTTTLRRLNSIIPYRKSAAPCF